MSNKGQFCGLFSIAILALCLFVLAGTAAAVDTHPGYEPEMHFFGDLQKTQIPVKAPAIRKAYAKTFPSIKMPAEMDLKRHGPGDLLEMRLDALKKTAALYQRKVASKPFANMRQLADNDMVEIVAGTYCPDCPSGYQATVMDESAEFWAKIPRKTYSDFHTDPKTPLLDVKPYTWFLIDHIKVNNTYYKWWEPVYQDYGKKYYGDVEFNVDGTYYSQAWDPPKSTVKLKTYVLEMTFRPEFYEYGYTSVKTHGIVYRNKTVSCEMRRGYVIFFE